MNVDRSIFIAFGAGSTRENEIWIPLRCAKLTDDLHVVQSSLKLRSVSKAQSADGLARCCPLGAHLLPGCSTETEGDEEQRPDTHDGMVRLPSNDSNLTSVPNEQLSQDRDCTHRGSVLLFLLLRNLGSRMNHWI